MNTYSSMPSDARKAIDSTAAALCLVHDSDTALDAVNKADDCIRSFPHCAQALTSLTMSSVETFLTENVAAHIRQFGSDNQYKAAAELHDMREPIFLSKEYLDNEDKISVVQDALVKLLSEIKSTDDYIARKPAIEALIGCVPFGRDELCGLTATRLRSLVVNEAIDDMVMAEQISYGIQWRYGLWAAYNALGCEDKPFALAFLDNDNLGPRFYHPSALGVNSAPIYYLMAADRIALLAKFTNYEDTAYLIQTLYSAITALLDAKNGDVGDKRLNRLVYAMRETFKTGSLSYWEHPVLANSDTDED